MVEDPFSRFKDTPLVVINGRETVGSWPKYQFLKQRPPSDLILVYQVTSQTEGRPDLIANAVYGTPKLDWVLLAFNNVIETLGWPRAGASIEYPSETVVLPELL